MVAGLGGYADGNGDEVGSSTSEDGDSLCASPPRAGRASVVGATVKVVGGEEGSVGSWDVVLSPVPLREPSQTRASTASRIIGSQIVIERVVGCCFAMILFLVRRGRVW